MISPPPLAEYEKKYSRIRFERRDGILQITFHADGEDAVWDLLMDNEVIACFADVATDRDSKVIILTGSGAAFIDRDDLAGATIRPKWWGAKIPDGKRLLLNHLDIQAPMIAAVNGPANIHAELALLCDIVLVADHATFQDRVHFPSGLIPGDGVQIIWPMLIGFNRARYFLLTGQKLTAQEALALGVVNEVMPQSELLPRAWELAYQLLKQPPLTLRLTRESLLQPLKEAVMAHVPHGMALEGLGAIDYWPPNKFGDLE